MQLVTPNEATQEVLLDVHTPEYLHEIKSSKTKVAQVSTLQHPLHAEELHLHVDQSNMLCRLQS